MLSASSRSRSPRKQMAAEENKMADSSDNPTPHHATMYDQSYHTRALSRNIWFIPNHCGSGVFFIYFDSFQWTFASMIHSFLYIFNNIDLVSWFQFIIYIVYLVDYVHYLQYDINNSRKHVSIAVGVNQILRNSAIYNALINVVARPSSVNAVAKFHRNMKRKKKHFG